MAVADLRVLMCVALRDHHAGFLVKLWQLAFLGLLNPRVKPGCLTQAPKTLKIRCLGAEAHGFWAGSGRLS